jgi:hypothetical protein
MSCPWDGSEYMNKSRHSATGCYNTTLWIGQDFEGIKCSLIKVLFQHLAGVTEENMETSVIVVGVGGWDSGHLPDQV